MFTPDRPNKFFVTKMSQINRDLNQKEGVNLPNPYFKALPEVNELINGNRRISLSNGNLSFYRERDNQQQSLTPIEPLKLPPSNASAAGKTPVLNPVNINNQATTAIRGQRLFNDRDEITFS